ncbi:MAG: hypothetical protein ACHQT8_07925, partial [Chlamydiales bacterium]
MAIALSFSAEYLFQGSKVLGFTPPLVDVAGWDNDRGNAEKLFAVARGVYSLGLLIIAPIGVVYHFALAGFYDLRIRCGDEAAILALQCLAHYRTAIVDLGAFLRTASGPALIAFLITSFIVLKYLLTLPLFISLPACAICALIGYLAVDFCLDFAPLITQEFLATIFLPLAYAKDRRYFLDLVRDDAPQHSIYLAYEYFKQYVRAGIAENRRLNPDEIDLISANVERRNQRIFRNVPILNSIEVPDFLFRWGGIRPAYHARVGALLAQQANISDAWREI